MADKEKSGSALQESFLISDLETLRAMSDPLRLQIMEALVKQPRTVKQIAKLLGTSSTKLYYHIALLEERRLIRVVDTRVVSGIIEKQYQAVAHNFIVNRSLFAMVEQDGGESANAFLTNILNLLDTAKAEISRSAELGLITVGGADQPERNSHKLKMIRAAGKLSPENIQAFYERLQELVEEFDELGQDDYPGGQNYNLTVAFYPVQQDAAEGDEPNQPEEV